MEVHELEAAILQQWQVFTLMNISEVATLYYTLLYIKYTVKISLKKKILFKISVTEKRRNPVKRINYGILAATISECLHHNKKGKDSPLRKH